MLTIYIILAFLGIVAWGFIAFWITESKFFPIWGTCGAGCILSYFRAYVFFAMNDFEYFQNVEKLNAYIDKHNKEVEENAEKRVKVQKDLADGTLMLPPPDPPVKPSNDGGGPADPESEKQPAGGDGGGQSQAEREQAQAE